MKTILVNYARHSTAVRADFTKIHGDRAGCAAQRIERDVPGAAAEARRTVRRHERRGLPVPALRASQE